MANEKMKMEARMKLYEILIAQHSFKSKSFFPSLLRFVAFWFCFHVGVRIRLSVSVYLVLGLVVLSLSRIWDRHSHLRFEFCAVDS